MAKGIYDWSTTADDNDDADASINWLEGQTAASVNNSSRAMMRRFAQWLKEYGGTCTVGGTADAVTLTTSTTYTSFATGIRLMFIPGADNTGAATINVDSVGVKKLRKISSGADTALSAGDIKDGLPCEIVYDAAADSAAGAWIVMNPQSTTALAASITAQIGLVLISTATPSGVATVDFTGLSSTYDEYEVHLQNVIPATDTAGLALRTSTDGGSTFAATGGDYADTMVLQKEGAAVSNVTFSTPNSIHLTSSGSDGVGNATNEIGVSGIIRIIQPSVAQYLQVLFDTTYTESTGGVGVRIAGAGRRLAAADVDAIRFLFTSGNIASGKIKLYGVRKS